MNGRKNSLTEYLSPMLMSQKNSTPRIPKATIISMHIKKVNIFYLLEDRGEKYKNEKYIFLLLNLNN